MFFHHSARRFGCFRLKVKMAASMTVAIAAASGDIEAVQNLLSRGADVNQRSNEGMSPLGIAAFWGYAEIVKMLLEHGADINQSNHGNLWTPLHCAAFQGHGKVIMYLMEYSPDTAVKDRKGRTPADFASAIDAVWPFFAAVGCKRTSKADLIRMDILKKVSSDDPTLRKPELLHFTQTVNSEDHRDNKQDVAAAAGDVLAGVEDTDRREKRGWNSGNATPLWNN